MIIALMATWGSVAWKKLTVNAGFALSILWIFIFYSKIHFGYHMMVLLVLIPWSLDDAKKLWTLFGISLLAGTVHLAWRDRLFTENPWIHLIFAALLWLYWVNWAIYIIKNQEFSKLKKNTQSEVIIASGWIVIFCMIYSIQVGLKKIIF